MAIRIYIILLVTLIPSIVFAHGSHGSGIMAGFTHPILGIDHAVAILGAGFLSYLIDKSKSILIFVPFLLAMIVGGFLGIEKEATFFIEKIIAASVAIIGFFILLNKELNQYLMLVALGIFGFFHGFAHGAEMPDAMNSIVYIAGYSLGSILMAALGVFLAKFLASKPNFDKLLYFVSGCAIGCGIIIILG